MIVQTKEYIDGREFTVTRSDLGYMILSDDGGKYAEAWDIPKYVHTYTETDEPIEQLTEEEAEAEYAEAGRIMLGVK